MKDASRHSEEMEDLISAPPSWMLRWGVTTFFIVLLALAGLSFYIRYPDIARGTLVVVQSPGTGLSGELSIAQAEVIKIHQGQEVLVKLHRYPFEKFGVVHGFIDAVDELPDSRGYFIAHVVFRAPSPQGIIIRERLTADAEVILQERSLMDRFLNSIHQNMAGD